MSIEKAVSLIITLISVLVAIIVPLIIHFKQTKKALSYEVLSATSLFANSEFGEFGDLKIYYKNQEISADLSLVLLKIINTGNLDIKEEEWGKQPITIKAPHDILAGDVKEQKPPHLTVKLNRRVLEEAYIIEIEPMLLNSGDYFILKLLVKSYNEDLKIMSRIAGVSDINKIKDKFKPTLFLPIVMSSLCFVWGVWYLFKEADYSLINITVVLLGVIIMSILVSTACIFAEWFEWMIKIRRKNKKG
ncbi:hypothetical protein M1K46_11755 [Fictibacillus sp. WQ 8-8]|uniref:hypothetical protein n=1 Tax=Fictibacillus sp. WQ 8-8 TaxID=2938788 RepID=UPI00210BBCA3|nr:hypothetical protein [Fictibacillus sp. WQ 8-8]MCQ6266332.1 hypothetical protein [Fictibacillus sp. WQ 8-8]